MSELVQFVVLQRSEKWVVKSRELERAFGDRRKAIHCAVELANESGKNGKPALVLAGCASHDSGVCQHAPAGRAGDSSAFRALRVGKIPEAEKIPGKKIPGQSRGN